MHLGAGIAQQAQIRIHQQTLQLGLVARGRTILEAALLLQPFELIVNWFDFCWYGHARVDKEMYQQVDEAFSTFEGLLRSVRVREEAIA